ncbi:MAG: histidine phosphatase family protein [Anaerolineae bacterium]|nr:histidine phosphatase family protein [Anaerolineae bacterium]
MAVQLTLIRHGESIWNATGRTQGHAPVPLSERGQEQARLAAEALRGDGPYTALYSSDLLRCRQTVAPIAAVFGLDVTYDARLREIDVGTWQGLTWDERLEYDAANHEAFTTDPFNVVLPGGESTRQMTERVQAGLEDILAAHPDGHVVIVAHGGSIRGILRYFDLWEPRFWGPGLPTLHNTCRTVLQVAEVGDTAQVLMSADVSHLPPELIT